MSDEIDNDRNWLRKFNAGLGRLQAMIDMPDRRAQQFVKICMKHGGFPAEERERYSELTLDELGPLVEAVVLAINVESERIVAGSITLTWLDPIGAIYKVAVSAPTMTAQEREEIEALARKWGFLTNGDEWTTPESSEAIAGFGTDARRDGFTVVWKDAP